MTEIKKCIGIAVFTMLCGTGFGAGFQLYTEGSAEALGAGRSHQRENQSDFSGLV